MSGYHRRKQALPKTFVIQSHSSSCSPPPPPPKKKKKKKKGKPALFFPVFLQLKTCYGWSPEIKKMKKSFKKTDHIFTNTNGEHKNFPSLQYLLRLFSVCFNECRSNGKLHMSGHKQSFNDLFGWGGFFMASLAARLSRGRVQRLTSGNFYMLPHRDRAERPCLLSQSATLY